MKLNKREKIILAITCLAAVSAGISVLLPQRATPPRTSGTAGEKAERVAAEAAESLARYRLTAFERALMEKARQAWPVMPFLPAEPPAPTTQPTVGQDPLETDGAEFRFTGYLALGDRQLAVVNGREYAVGETIMGSTYKVYRISPTRAVLTDHTGRTLAIPLLDPGTALTETRP